MTMACESPQQISRVLVPNLDSLIVRTTGKQMSGVKCYCSNNVLVSECSQQITSVRVPKSDGPVRRPTGKDIVGSEFHWINYTLMSNQSSQQISSVLVPDLDSLIRRTTSNQISGVKCNGDSTISIISRTVECFKQSIIYIKERNYLTATVRFVTLITERIESKIKSFFVKNTRRRKKIFWHWALWSGG